MSGKLEFIAGSLPDHGLESLSKEVWLDDRQLLQLGRYRGQWQVTIMESSSISWKDFMRIVVEFNTFVSEEEKTIARQEDIFEEDDDLTQE